MTKTETEFHSAGRTFPGVFFEPDTASPPERRPGVLVLHGGAGLGAHERERAGVLADLGYVAFAPDLFGEVFASRARGTEVITALVGDPPALRRRLTDALAHLRAHGRVDASRLATIGFCFGGLAALELARSGADLRAVVTFHGGLTTHAPAAVRLPTGRCTRTPARCTASPSEASIAPAPGTTSVRTDGRGNRCVHCSMSGCDRVSGSSHGIDDSSETRNLPARRP